MADTGQIWDKSRVGSSPTIGGTATAWYSDVRTAITGLTTW